MAGGRVVNKKEEQIKFLTRQKHVATYAMESISKSIAGGNQGTGKSDRDKEREDLLNLVIRAEKLGHTERAEDKRMRDREVTKTIDEEPELDDST